MAKVTTNNIDCIIDKATIIIRENVNKFDGFVFNCVVRGKNAEGDEPVLNVIISSADVTGKSSLEIELFDFCDKYNIELNILECL